MLLDVTIGLLSLCFIFHPYGVDCQPLLPIAIDFSQTAVKFLQRFEFWGFFVIIALLYFLFFCQYLPRNYVLYFPKFPCQLVIFHLHFCYHYFCCCFIDLILVIYILVVFILINLTGGIGFLDAFVQSKKKASQEWSTLWNTLK